MEDICTQGHRSCVAVCYNLGSLLKEASHKIRTNMYSSSRKINYDYGNLSSLLKSIHQNLLRQGSGLNVMYLSSCKGTYFPKLALWWKYFKQCQVR